MRQKIEAAIRETLVIENKVSIKRCVDKILLIVEQQQALQQANVSRLSEQVCLHPREHRSYIGEGYLRCGICGAEFR